MEIEVAMRRANELSLLGLGLVSPNPIVGALILDESGSLISEGFHSRAGGKHAEVAAIENANRDLTDSTLVVTLEPCNHQGKTPPCTEAIIKSGIKRVIYSIQDPNPIAQGGASRLEAAGIKVESGVLSGEVAAANRAWLNKLVTGRPFITMKIASTIDGKIAAVDGSSKWITSENSRRDVARLRSECDAIVTGTGTIIADDPQLTVRGVSRPGISEEFSPVRIVLGKREIPSDAKINNDAAETIHLKTEHLDELIELATSRGWNRILVEAGPRLSTAFLKMDLVDEIYWYQAPTLLGNGQSAIGDLGINTLAERKDLRLIESVAIPSGAGDMRIHLSLGGN